MKKALSAMAITIPDDLATALASQPKADRAFRALPPSHQREYVKWIVEAKKPETRSGRVAKTVQRVLGEELSQKRP
jgi:uncharacterized protein YdeI (YjbR/CyaY-like superfamily)